MRQRRTLGDYFENIDLIKCQMTMSKAKGRLIIICPIQIESIIKNSLLVKKQTAPCHMNCKRNPITAFSIIMAGIFLTTPSVNSILVVAMLCTMLNVDIVAKKNAP